MDDYYAFLLRLQRKSERPNWHATLENIDTGEVLHFRSAQELLAYLSHSMTLSLAETARDGRPTRTTGFEKA